MKNLIYYIFVLLTINIHITTYSQKFSYKFGEITNADIELTAEKIDPEAEAVIIFDLGTSKFIETSNNIEIEYTRHTRIKIFNESGFDYAKVEIPYYREGNIFERVSEIEAFTFTFEEGQPTRTPLDVKNVYDEKVNEYWHVKKFALPAVKEGSIIEYSYKIETPAKFNLKDWEFQYKIPVIYSEYLVKMIPFYEYTYLLQGASSFDVFDKYKDEGLARFHGPATAYGNSGYHDLVYKFGMKDVPAFKDESFITSMNDYIIKLDFQLARIHRRDGVRIDVIKSWPELSNELLKLNEFGKYIKSSSKAVKKVMEAYNVTEMDEAERFNFIVNYVKSNYKWNGTTTKYAYSNVNSFMKEKTGTSGDMNLFLAGFLNQANIEAYPVILSTRSNGKIKADYPFTTFFNYVIVMAKVNGKLVLTDATDPYLPNDIIPSFCINDRGFIIKKDSESWIDLSQTKNTKSTTNINISFNENNDLILGSFKITANNYDAVNYRKKYGSDIEEVRSDMKKQGYNEIKAINIHEPSDDGKKFQMELSVRIPTKIIEDKIFIAPFLHESITSNPFIYKERTYPIDMVYSFQKSFTSSISIPEGYAISYLPDNYSTENKIITIKYQVNQVNDSTIDVAGAYVIEKNLYQPDEYVRLKFYYDKIIEKFNDNIILEKKQ